MNSCNNNNYNRARAGLTKVELKIEEKKTTLNTISMNDIAMACHISMQHSRNVQYSYLRYGVYYHVDTHTYYVHMVMVFNQPVKSTYLHTNIKYIGTVMDTIKKCVLKQTNHNQTENIFTISSIYTRIHTHTVI